MNDINHKREDARGKKLKRDSPVKLHFERKNGSRQNPTRISADVWLNKAKETALIACGEAAGTAPREMLSLGTAPASGIIVIIELDEGRKLARQKAAQLVGEREEEESGNGNPNHT